MTETLLRVRREDPNCECVAAVDAMVFAQYFEGGRCVRIPCPHGSTVEIIPAQTVQCEACRGEGRTGRWVNDGCGDGHAEVNDCEACLATGLRLAKKED